MVVAAWLIAAPQALEYGGAARLDHRVVGTVAAATAILSLTPVLRPLRWLQVPLGAWLLVAPGVLTYGGLALANSLGVGFLLIALAFVGAAAPGRYGGGWGALRPLGAGER